MLKRTISGAVYVATVIGFFLLRNYVDYRLFDVLTAFFCAVGTFEIARAVKSYLVKSNFTLAVVFGCIFTPVFYLAEACAKDKGDPTLVGACVCLILTVTVVILQAFICGYAAGNGKEQGKTEKSAIKLFAPNVLPFLYPSLLLLTFICANRLDSGYICLLLIFVISPASDTFAYLVGMTYNKIRKGKAKKLCPVLSPKKTWAGAIGGVIGGVVGALVIYFIYGKNAVFIDGVIPTVVTFIAVGVISSVLTEIGDLFESYIKRKVGIKDMGRIMPGHGGIMDRIDGMSLAGAFIYFWFLIFVG